MDHIRPLRQMFFDEFLQAVAVALFEGGSVRLAVVREDDQFVGARRFAGDHIPEMSDDLIPPA